jgi:ribosomal protein S18 acetylase RimI-like enzyme
VIIRRAVEDDLPTLGRLGALLVRTHHAFDSARFMAPSDSVEEGYAWYLGTQLEKPDVVVLVAEDAGRVLGYVFAGLEPRSWMELRDDAGFIHDVAVEEDARRAGVGTRLMEEAAAWLEEQGAPRVMLWTAQANDGAQQLFTGLGFRVTMLEMTRETTSRDSG